MVASIDTDRMDGMLQTGLLVCGETNRWPDTVEQAEAAESLGYDSVWLAESHFRDNKDTPSPLMGMAALAAVTRRVRLGTAVVVAPLAHPVALAEQTALLQEMSGGRFVCGLGMGHRDDEFATFEIPRSERRRRLEETVELLRALWVEEDVTYHGEIHEIENVNVLPKPDSIPPIWIGGWAPAAVRRAALIADAWFPGPTAHLEKLRDCYAIYDEARTETGVPPGDRPLMREVWVGETQAEIERGRHHLQLVYEEEYPAIAYGSVGAGDVSSSRAFVGSPQQVVEDVTRWREELMFDHLIARMHLRGADQRAVLRSMELFADQVMPALRSGPSI